MKINWIMHKLGYMKIPYKSTVVIAYRHENSVIYALACDIKVPHGDPLTYDRIEKAVRILVSNTSHTIARAHGLVP